MKKIDTEIPKKTIGSRIISVLSTFFIIATFALLIGIAGTIGYFIYSAK